MKTAVEGAIANVQAQARLGLAVYVGDHSSGTCKLNYDAVPIALNNSFAIDAGYESLGPLQPYPTAKADTPAGEALVMAQAALAADPGDGGKFLLFITSGLTDFCDDAPVECAADALTFQIQQLYASTPSIETLVVGLPPDLANEPIAGEALANFANAGAGQPVVPALNAASEGQGALYPECHFMTDGGPQSWSSLFTASGKTAPAPDATYGTTEGTAPLYMSASGSATDIETAVNAALAAVKSCAFDLSVHSIDPNKLGEATVTIGGVKVPQDGTIGWSMPTTTELVLNGFACSALRQPNANVSFSFPCDAVLN